MHTTHPHVYAHKHTHTHTHTDKHTHANTHTHTHTHAYTHTHTHTHMLRKVTCSQMLSLTSCSSRILHFITLNFGTSALFSLLPWWLFDILVHMSSAAVWSRSIFLDAITTEQPAQKRWWFFYFNSMYSIVPILLKGMFLCGTPVTVCIKVRTVGYFHSVFSSFFFFFGVGGS